MIITKEQVTKFIESEYSHLVSYEKFSIVSIYEHKGSITIFCEYVNSSYMNGWMHQISIEVYNTTYKSWCRSVQLDKLV
jgi:hypothetical protein